MSRNLAHIFARAFETPLLLHPRKAEVIASVLAAQMGSFAPMLDVAEAKAEAEATRAGRSQMLDRFDGERRGPQVTDAWGDTYTQTRYLYRDSVALITVEGSLVNRGAWIGANMSGLTSYEGVTAQLASAATDPDVRTILLDIESPGGEATGAFEMSDYVRAVAQQKPVIAVVNGMAASAGYAMISGASRIVTTRSGLCGSIGVVLLHLDRSKQLEKSGIKPTLIYAGGHKVDGNPFEPLPEDVRADFQAEVNGLYELFVANVAQGRGLSPDAVRATQARCFVGQDAIDAGLADEIGTLPDLFTDLTTTGGGIRGLSRGYAMKTYTEAEHQAALQAQADQNKVALAAADAAAGVAGAAAVDQDRKRIGAILGHEEAKGREAQAHHLAFVTTMSVDEAVATLKHGAKATAGAPATKGPRLEVPDPKLDANAEPGKASPWAAVVDTLNKR